VESQSKVEYNTPLGLPVVQMYSKARPADSRPVGIVKRGFSRNPKAFIVEDAGMVASRDEARTMICLKSTP